MENETVILLSHMYLPSFDEEEKQALSKAIKALQEIQQYREIGTVEEIKEILQIISEGQDDVDESGISTGLLHTLLEYADYKKIGTVEECREARKRRKAKKPIKYSDTRQGLDNDGNSISWQEDCYECPTCESFLGYVSDCEDENYQDNYCKCCGQAIEWY